MSSWLLLLIAGLFEAVWAVGLKYTDGFTRPLSSVLTLGAMGVSVWLLALATRSLPIGTAYAVWVGIGAVGAVLYGIVVFHESTSPARIFFLGLLVVALIGLRMVDNSGESGL